MAEEIEATMYIKGMDSLHLASAEKLGLIILLLATIAR